MSVRVLVHARIREGEQAGFEAAFAQVRAAVAGTPGHIEDQLLRSETDPTAYILLSHWESRERFAEWEDAPIHRQLTTPMRPYWSGSVERLVYDVAV